MRKTRGKKRQDGTANGRGLSPVRRDSPEVDVLKVGLSLSLSCHNMTLQLWLTLAAFMVMDCAEELRSAGPGRIEQRAETATCLAGRWNV